MILYSENRAVIMTEDRKCILKGNGDYNRTLCLVDEPTKLKIKTFRGIKSAETYYNSRRIKLSKGVIDLYHLSPGLYHKETGPKLVGIKVRCKYEMLD